MLAVAKSTSVFRRRYIIGMEIQAHLDDCVVVLEVRKYWVFYKEDECRLCAASYDLPLEGGAGHVIGDDIKLCGFLVEIGRYAHLHGGQTTAS